MKSFDVVANDPRHGNKETTFRSVPASRLKQNDSGETRFYINDFYPSVEVITATMVVDKGRSYFDKYGTAGE
jgi:hypothetical protein